MPASGLPLCRLRTGLSAPHRLPPGEHCSFLPLTSSSPTWCPHRSTASPAGGSTRRCARSSPGSTGRRSRRTWSAAASATFCSAGRRRTSTSRPPRGRTRCGPSFPGPGSSVAASASPTSAPGARSSRWRRSGEPTLRLRPVPRECSSTTTSTAPVKRTRYAGTSPSTPSTTTTGTDRSWTSPGEWPTSARGQSAPSAIPRSGTARTPCGCSARSASRRSSGSASRR